MKPDEGAPPEKAPRARDTYRKHVDKKLLAALKRRSDATLIHHYDLPIHVREPVLHVEPERWNTGFLTVREYEAPYELQQDLHQLTPQALLRDLYRPLRDLYWVEREPLTPLDWGGRRGVSDARDMRKLAPRPHVAPASEWVEDLQHYHRELVWRRWEPKLRDDQPRARVSVMYDPSMNL